MKVTLFINGNMARVEQRTPLIEAARMLGISIPTLIEMKKALNAFRSGC